MIDGDRDRENVENAVYLAWIWNCKETDNQNQKGYDKGRPSKEVEPKSVSGIYHYFLFFTASGVFRPVRSTFV